MQSLFSALLDSSLVLAGHGYDFRGSGGGSGGGDDGGGIGMLWILAVVVLAVAAVAVLTLASRDEHGPEAGDGAPAIRPKAVAPVAFIVAIIAAPLILWTASSGSEEDWDLKVERFTSVSGAPELLVSLRDEKLNTLDATSGRRTVRVECVGRQGQPVLDARQKWPFVKERGYDYPHAHQAATSAQVQRADRCRVRGARVGLQADVEGSLKG